MSAHGAVMVGATALASCAVMWFFLRKYVRLSTAIFATNYALVLLGAVLILGAIFVGNYGGAWTFLYPLPVQSMNVWSTNSAVVFMLGYLAIGVGFLLFYLDTMRAVIRRYGNLGRALGLPWLFGGEIDKSHPKTVVASTMVMITNSIGTLVGAIALVMSIINAYYPAWVPDALVIKNFIYLFGHMFINATIYMAALLFLTLLVAPLRHVLEASMTAQMLAQIPLLILVGWLLRSAVPERMRAVIANWNSYGITGLLLALLSIAYWMLPRALDAASSDPFAATLKYLTLPLLVGLPLSLSWPRMNFIVKGVLLVEFIAMFFRLGWLYMTSPTRLCSNYLIGDQQRLGQYMLIIGGALLLWIAWKLLWGQFTPIDTDDSPISTRQHDDPSISHSTSRSQ